jgi:hypothetical protein
MTNINKQSIETEIQKHCDPLKNLKAGLFSQQTLLRKKHEFDTEFKEKMTHYFVQINLYSRGNPIINLLK